MKMKKIAALAAAFMLALTMAPMSADAKTNNNEISLYSMEAGSACHCGGTRLETTTESMSSVACPTHGASCGNCYLVSVRTYYHCTNPQCTDIWYGPVTRTYYTHIYG